LRLLFVEPISSIIENIYEYFGFLSVLWVLSAPFVALCLYLIHRVAWFIFISHASLLFIGIIYLIINDPIPYNFLYLTFNGVIVLILGIILTRDFRAPYFQVLPRSWRETTRFPIIHQIKVHGITKKISDLSEMGCFITAPELGLTVGKRIEVELKSETLNIQCEGAVMRQSPQGYGIKFLHLSQQERRDIKSLIKKRYALRYIVNFSGKWLYNGKKKDVKVLNISKCGCFIHTSLDDFLLTDGTLILDIDNIQFKISCKVIWINKQIAYGKPVGFGVEFYNWQKKLIKLVRKRAPQLTR
jgi:hypothetical protein